jgi:hypothetical protein
MKKETHPYKKGKVMPLYFEKEVIGSYVGCKVCSRSARDHTDFFKRWKKFVKKLQKSEEKKKPSVEIEEIAIRLHSEGIDPGFNGNRPDINDWVFAIIEYLDKKYEEDNLT